MRNTILALTVIAQAAPPPAQRPEETEVWQPEPPVVVAAATFGRVRPRWMTAGNNDTKGLHMSRH